MAHGVKYPIIEYTKPSGDHFVLESLPTLSKMVQVLRPTKNITEFKIGRGLDQDLRINDISVSRNHATIKYKDNSFILDDNYSKFGTLVMIKNGLKLYPGMNRTLQIGRSIVNLRLVHVPAKKVKNNNIMYAAEEKLDLNKIKENAINTKK